MKSKLISIMFVLLFVCQGLKSYILVNNTGRRITIVFDEKGKWYKPTYKAHRVSLDDNQFFDVSRLYNKKKKRKEFLPQNIKKIVSFHIYLEDVSAYVKTKQLIKAHQDVYVISLEKNGDWITLCSEGFGIRICCYSNNIRSD